MLSIVWSLLSDNDWWALPVFLCKLNPIKAHWGKGSWPFFFERSLTFPAQADHVLVDLFSSMAAVGGGPVGGAAPPSSLFTGFFCNPSLFLSSSRSLFPYHSVTLFSVLFRFPSHFLLYIYCKFFLCGYHEVHIKHPICISAYFKLIAT